MMWQTASYWLETCSCSLILGHESSKFTCSCSLCLNHLLLLCEGNLSDIYTHSLSLLPPIFDPLCYSFTLFSLSPSLWAFRMTYEIRPLLPNIHTHTYTQSHCDGLPEVITHLSVVRSSWVFPAKPPGVVVGPSRPWRRGLRPMQRPLIAVMTEASAGSHYSQKLSASCIALSFFHLWGPWWWHRP